MIQYVWLIPTIMALAALVNGLGVRRLGRVAGYISVGAMALTFLISCGIFLETRHILHEAEHKAAALTTAAERSAVINAEFVEKGSVTLWRWIDIPGVLGPGRDLVVDFKFYVDPLSSIFLLFISFIGTLVFLYATGYMKEKHGSHGHDDHGHDDHGHGHHHHGHGHDEWVLDPGYARFFAYVALFAASMYILILGANLPMMFIGWEGVGLCSYLLIGYFFDKQFSETLSCAGAGRKAFVMNRIGDFGLMLGMFLLFWGLGSVEIQSIVNIVAEGKLPNGGLLPAGFGYGGAIITAAALLMFLGATGKSAQIPLFTWLPDAMAGPTPVSALIHAATMVTAGVYMVARLNVVYMSAPTAMAVVAIIGALTAFIAAYAGLTQRGIKKALAYSTVSQLGFMFLAMGVGAFAAGIFHVFTHAFFKGCLFLCAGSVIHALHHEEDMFKMGGLKKKMPITALTYFIAMLCIAGVPLTSGFFSKDEILYMAFLSKGDGQIPILYIIGIATAIMTALYMARTYYLTFEGESRVDPHVEAHVHESPKSMTMPLIILASVAAVIGFVNVPKGLIPMGGFNAAFHHFLAPVTDRGAAVVARATLNYQGSEYPYGADVVAGKIAESHGSLELILAVVSGAIALIAIFAIARPFYTKGVAGEQKLSRGPLRILYNVSLARWWWDDFYNAVFQRGAWKTSVSVWHFDVRIVDGLVNGIGKFTRGIGKEFRRLQNGQTQVYGLVMILGVVAFLLYFAIGMANFLGQELAPGQSPRVLQPMQRTTSVIPQPDEATASIPDFAPLTIAVAAE